MKSLILCAGFGERLRPLTETLAKPAIPFLNIPMMAYPLYWLEQESLDELVVNTHHLPSTVATAARNIASTDYRLTLIDEQPDILGGGGAIWNARRQLEWDDTFFVANGDAVIFFDRDRPLQRLSELQKKSDAIATLLVCPLEGVGTEKPGVWINGFDDVVGFGTTAPAGEDLRCRHFASVMVLSSRIFNYLRPGFSNILYDILLPLILSKKESVNVIEDETMKWFETGNLAEFLAASRTCLQMLNEPEGQRFRVFDILDRFSAGWRNFQAGEVYAFEPLGAPVQSRGPILFGRGAAPSNAVTFAAPAAIDAGREWQKRPEPLGGVYIDALKKWI